MTELWIAWRRQRVGHICPESRQNRENEGEESFNREFSTTKGRKHKKSQTGKIKLNSHLETLE